ncbi:MAG: glycosyltransferase family 9 protein [bacterium]|nr:glycosyltransferase family 9 protein [bacterium]
MRWLIIQTAFLGDVILTLPLIAKINQIDSQSEILFITRPEAVNVIETAKGIVSVVSYDKRGAAKGWKGWKDIQEIIHSFQAEITVVPHRSLRSVALAVASKAKYRIGYNRAALFPGLTHRIRYRYDAHETARLLDLLYPFTKEWGKPTQPNIQLTANDEEVAKFHLNQLPQPIIAIAPGAVWNTKKYPIEQYEQIAKQLSEKKYSIVTIGGLADQSECERVAKAGKGSSLGGLLTPRESAAVIKQCKILVTNDSAPLHLAQSVGTPTLAIFGATVPSFGFAPIGEKDMIAEVHHLDCRPCAIHGGKKCPKKHFRCMKEISPQSIVELIEQMTANNL